MGEQLYLIDFENVPGVDLSGISLESRVIVFTGVNQKTVPLELVAATQRFGDRLQWRRVDATGRNALDFFIACELGRVQAAADGTSCTVLSNDKGFDPLLRHLNSVGIACQRIGTATPLPSAPKPAPKKAAAPKAAAPKTAPKAKAVAKPKAPPKPVAPPTPIKRVLEILGKTEKKSRPTKRKTLAKAISSLFQEKIGDAEVDAIIAKLISDKKITETAGAITYAF